MAARPTLPLGAQSHNAVDTRHTEMAVAADASRQVSEPTSSADSTRESDAGRTDTTQKIWLEGDIIMPLNVPRPKTYADTTNLALKYPEVASQILALPMPPPTPVGGKPTKVGESTGLSPQQMAPHAEAEPNWAMAPDDLGEAPSSQKRSKRTRQDRPTRGRGRRTSAAKASKSGGHTSSRSPDPPSALSCPALTLGDTTRSHTEPQFYSMPPSPPASSDGMGPSVNEVDALIALLQEARMNDPALRHKTLLEVDLELNISGRLRPATAAGEIASDAVHGLNRVLAGTGETTSPVSTLAPVDELTSSAEQHVTEETSSSSRDTFPSDGGSWRRSPVPAEQSSVDCNPSWRKREGGDMACFSSKPFSDAHPKALDDHRSTATERRTSGPMPRGPPPPGLEGTPRRSYGFRSGRSTSRDSFGRQRPNSKQASSSSSSSRNSPEPTTSRPFWPTSKEASKHQLVADPPVQKVNAAPSASFGPTLDQLTTIRPDTNVEACTPESVDNSGWIRG